MTLQYNNTPTSKNNHELKQHGNSAFPCGHYENNPNENYVDWHWHEEYEMSIIKQGTVCFSVGQKSVVLQTGDGIFINSGVLHSVSSVNGEDCLIHCTVFHGRFVYGTLDNILWQKYIQPITTCSDLAVIVLKHDVPWQQQILNEIKQVGASYTWETGFEFIVREHLSKVFFLIFKNCKELIIKKTQDSYLEAERMKIMLQFIHLHWNEPITLANIASSCNICERECLRCFKNIINLSPIQYLIQYRISNACKMLHERKYNITEICDICGFTSPSYFSKTFKKVVGCTPSEYR